MSNTYLSEGNQIVLKEEFRNILVAFENDYFETDTDVFEEYSNKLLELFNKTIADLEAKLAESESELETQKEKYDKLYGCYKKTSNEDLQDKYRLVEENEQLKQQLAEKIQKYQMTDDNYTRLNEKYDLLESRHELLLEENLKLEQQLAEKDAENKKLSLLCFGDKNTEIVLTTDKMINHIKMSFAVEQLEKVKEEFIQIADNVREEYTEDYFMISLGNIKRTIDNQIKQLKEGK